MKNKHKKIGAFFAVLSLVLVACSTAQLSQAEAAAQTGANILETINTDTGGGVTLFTQAAANAALKATHNSGDQTIVDATIAEAAAALKVQQAAAAANLNSTAGQQVTTALLTSPSLIAIGANAVATPNTAAGATP